MEYPKSICKNCKYWFIREKWETDKAVKIPNVGLCEKIITNGMEEKVILDLEHSGLECNAFLFTPIEGRKSGLITKSEFGCALFELFFLKEAEFTAGLS